MGIDDYEIETMIAVFVIIILIFAGIAAILYFYHGATIAPFKATCENNPRLRYAQNCTSYADCVNKCVLAQEKEAKT
jgi:hypothetical protein